MLPFVRPTIEEEDIRAVTQVLRSGWITTGPKAREFEVALERYVGGGAHVRVVNSGTSALEIALLAAGIGPGDEVIVPSMSFVASANAVLRAGAKPVLVDVDLESRNLTAELLRGAVTPRTRAVMPVHFAGLAADMDPIEALARELGLRVIEDAAHAIGTRYRGRLIGGAGDLVCFSFHPNKNITSVEGGAIACFDGATAERIERLRFHGIEKFADGSMEVDEWGGKMNLPDVNAVLGLVQLPRLQGFVERRRELAARYRERLPRHDCLAQPAFGQGHGWHIFAVRVDFARLATTRPAFQARLADLGIATGVHYPAIHGFAMYRRMGYGPEQLPNAHTIGAQTLTLPLFPALGEADVDGVCAALAETLGEFEA